MTQVKAESGIPVPENKRGIKPKYPWETMEVNESFPMESASSYSQALATSQRLAPKTFRAGRYDGKWRVWRVK